MRNLANRLLRTFLLGLIPGALSHVLPAAPAVESRRPAPSIAAVDQAVERAIADRKLPGAVLWAEGNGTVYHRAYGRRALVPTVEAMTEDTVFDAASLTKVVATTPAILILVERGRLELDAPVAKYIPEFRGEGRERITLRQLLTHTSGLRPDLDTQPPWKGEELALQKAFQETLRSEPGTRLVYSDINFILLGEVVRRVSGQRLDRFVEREIYRPLRMKDTGFRPPTSLRKRIAPTEKLESEVLRGVVHDPTSRFMGGVAGHAGLFTTAADLARYARMLVGLGELDGTRVMKPETVRLMTSVHTPATLAAKRGLGWDIDSPFSRPKGTRFPAGSYGHTGFTGTSIWIEPSSKAFWILLSNRVHPDGRGDVLPLQRELADLIAPRILPERLLVRDGEVLDGIDVLRRDQFQALRGMKVGLITNHSGHDRERRSTIDLLFGATNVSLRALFAPEHGVRGQLDELVPDATDDRTGLPIHSLYGTNRAPRLELLRGLDALVFDVQDIGCRFYTYISTLGLCVERAAEAKVKFFVLDRPNPINGVTVEGPVYQGSPEFTAFHALPLRHGMTVGELALLFNAERGWGCDLKVIRVEGWRRSAWFDQTGQPWTNPSPNMRRLTAAILYPGVGLVESAVSVGRGTDTPFEIVGAPYVNDVRFAAALNQAGLPGIRFHPVQFLPKASVFKDQACQGAALVVNDRDRLSAVDVGIVIASTLQRLYPGQFALEKVGTLLRDPETMEALRAGKGLEEIKRSWAAGLEQFRARRKAYLLYD